MTVDFWVLLVVLVLMFIGSFVMGLIASPAWALISAVPTLLVYAWFLWNQYCLRAGNCTVLAWLNVVFITLGFLSTLVILAVTLHYHRKDAKKKEEKEADKDDEKEKFFPVGVPHEMMFKRS